MFKVNLKVANVQFRSKHWTKLNEPKRNWTKLNETVLMTDKKGGKRDIPKLKGSFFATFSTTLTTRTTTTATTTLTSPETTRRRTTAWPTACRRPLKIGSRSGRRPFPRPTGWWGPRNGQSWGPQASGRWASEDRPGSSVIKLFTGVIYKCS